jgi:hypothetical protein
MKINLILEYILYVFLGIIFILLTLYRRLGLQRLPKSLEFWNEQFNVSLFIIISLWVILSLFIIIMSIRILLNKDTKDSFFGKVAGRFSDILNQAYYHVYHFIATYVPDHYNKISSFAKVFYNFWSKRPDEQIHFIVIGCRFVILGAFLFDVFYFFELKYFYKSLILLCIPLIINSIIFVLRDFALNKEQAEQYLDITLTSIDKVTGEPSYQFKIAKEFESLNLNLDYHVKEYIICSKIVGYLQWYDKYKAYFTPRVNLIIYSLYLIGWLYVLCFNILIFKL